MKATIIEPTGKDERGYTAEFLQDRIGKQLIVFRKAGTISGRHYHKGLSATKNPEILILMHGTCTFNHRHIDEEQVHSAQYTGPVHFEIPPLVWHELLADTDCTFIELNSIEEHASDTFYLQ
jgi:hypothetical protein